MVQQRSKPEDQRVRMTKAMIQQAFLRLLAEKPLQAVTVKELCALAGVNRGTFYLHYRDVYDLLEQMEQALLDELEATLVKGPILPGETRPDDAARLFDGIYRFVDKNRALCAILLGENGDKKFVAAIIDRTRRMALEGYAQLFPTVSRQEAELYYTFVAWGFIGLLQHSLQHPEALDLRTMAEGAQRIIESSGDYFAAMA